jgi:hypothetical protein
MAEGWRTQMAPLYILAVVVVASRLPAMLGRAAAPGWCNVLASVAIASLALSGGVLAGWLLPVVSLPAPTGPHAVGLVDRELFDVTRGRRLMVSIRYPAAEVGAPAPLTHDPDQVMTALANLTGLPAPLFHHLRYVRLAASEGPPLLADQPPFPVLVFPHGLVGMRLQSSSKLRPGELGLHRGGNRLYRCGGRHGVSRRRTAIL